MRSTAQPRILNIWQSPKRKRFPVVELDEVACSAAIAIVINEGAVPAVAIPDFPTDICEICRE